LCAVIRALLTFVHRNVRIVIEFKNPYAVVINRIIEIIYFKSMRYRMDFMVLIEKYEAILFIQKQTLWIIILDQSSAFCSNISLVVN
jgi:hypothetical protein